MIDNTDPRRSQFSPDRSDEAGAILEMSSTLRAQPTTTTNSAEASRDGRFAVPRSGHSAPVSRRSTGKLKKGSERSGLGWVSPHAIVGITCIVLIAGGWLFSERLDLSAADGIGYGLGITGLSMMILLLGYSVRKRAKAMREVGPLRRWFEWHLVLGLLGPTVILYHAGFRLGSINATVSLLCVLAVSGSGVGGRFLYGRMHRSLAGPRRSVHSMRKVARNTLNEIEPACERVPVARRALEEFESFALPENSTLLGSLRAIALRPTARRTKRRISQLLGQTYSSKADTVRIQQVLSTYLSEIVRAGELRLFEQLFSLWHAIHVPLTIILFVSAAIHIVAVHLY